MTETVIILSHNNNIVINYNLFTILLRNRGWQVRSNSFLFECCFCLVRYRLSLSLYKRHPSFGVKYPVVPIDGYNPKVSLCKFLIIPNQINFMAIFCNHQHLANDILNFDMVLNISSFCRIPLKIISMYTLSILSNNM